MAFRKSPVYDAKLSTLITEYIPYTDIPSFIIYSFLDYDNSLEDLEYGVILYEDDEHVYEEKESMYTWLHNVLLPYDSDEEDFAFFFRFHSPNRKIWNKQNTVEKKLLKPLKKMVKKCNFHIDVEETYDGVNVSLMVHYKPPKIEETLGNIDLFTDYLLKLN